MYQRKKTTAELEEEGLDQVVDPTSLEGGSVDAEAKPQQAVSRVKPKVATNKWKKAFKDF